MPLPVTYVVREFIQHKSAYSFFFFNDTATTEIYTLSLHDALPIWEGKRVQGFQPRKLRNRARPWSALFSGDRKSTRLNSSHDQISYAVFCLKKKKTSGISRGCSRRTVRSSLANLGQYLRHYHRATM